jgi:hypothetical protein
MTDAALLLLAVSVECGITLNPDERPLPKEERWLAVSMLGLRMRR